MVSKLWNEIIESIVSMTIIEIIVIMWIMTKMPITKIIVVVPLLSVRSNSKSCTRHACCVHFFHSSKGVTSSCVPDHIWDSNWPYLSNSTLSPWWYRCHHIFFKGDSARVPRVRWNPPKNCRKGSKEAHCSTGKNARKSHYIDWPSNVRKTWMSSACKNWCLQGVFAASRQQKDLQAFSCYRLQTSLASIAVRIG